MKHVEQPLTFAARCARNILLATQGSRFRGVGGYSPEAFAARRDSKPFPQASRESSLYRDFFAFFQGVFDAEAEIRGKTVLDFGSGYGGRTVDYARLGGARFVWGVEPAQIHTDLAQQYAMSLNVNNVEFRTCGETSVPLPDESVDVVVSYDVLEHALSPPASVEELFRVLRPGGIALLVFPVYLGMRSHHLDYVTSLPGLHWIFGADTLVSAVNSIICEDLDMTRFGTRKQPTPRMSFDGRRRVLPMLNGLGGSHLLNLFQKFSIVKISRHVVIRSKPGLRVVTNALSSAWFPMWLRDAVTDSVSCVLRKP
jgi:SAM-dependent methyltransferase